MCPTPSRTFSTVVELLLGVEELLGGGGEVRQRLVADPDPQGQGLQSLLAGVGGLGLLLGLVGEVQVLEPLGVVGGADGVAELLGELALGLDGPEDRLLPLGQLAEAGDPELDLPDGHLVEIARPLLPVAGDEGHRVALVEQLDDALDLDAADLQVLRNPAQVDLNRRRGVHTGFHLRRRDGGDTRRAARTLARVGEFVRRAGRRIDRPLNLEHRARPVNPPPAPNRYRRQGFGAGPMRCTRRPGRSAGVCGPAGRRRAPRSGPEVRPGPARGGPARPPPRRPRIARVDRENPGDRGILTWHILQGGVKS